jgi:putative membrane-bound dehydrogenase-like protein
MRMPTPVLVGISWLAFSTATQAEGPAVRLPPGFKITLYADETLADDIQALTLDRHGRVVVTAPGYVKTLHETGGKVTRTTVYATPRSGGMGMCFLGDDLLITADNWLLRYRDKDGDGQADGPPERIIPLATGEHGGHAIRVGPDGWIYVIGGNDAGIDSRHVGTPTSPVKKPVAGAIVRLSPDLKTCEVVAHGFRNPYDFDFNARGDLFTYDSDCERDEFLPWYTPTRAFHVAEAGHHGWRLKGYLRSFARTPDLFDTIPPFADLGRGSPTGVACYRHDAFPAHYRGGLFLADWTFGRVHFLPLDPADDGYKTKPEVFLDPIGSDGFAPTDLAVAPDGALLICIGGRKTRGSVYRIEYVGAKEEVRRELLDLDKVLHAHQPLDTWSRERWVPIAQRLGAGPFVNVLKDKDASEPDRIRAVEVLVELFDGFDAKVAETIWESASIPLRSRIAWALERRLSWGNRPARLAQDEPSLPVHSALLSLVAKGRLEDPGNAILTGLSLPSPRIIPQAERSIRSLTPPTRAILEATIREAGPATRLNHALVLLHQDGFKKRGREAIDTALSVLDTVDAGSPGLLQKATDPELRALVQRSVRRLRLDALRLLVVALGDWDLDHSEAEAFVPYTITQLIEPPDMVRSAIFERVLKIFPSGDDRVDLEASRLLGMLGNDRESIRRAVAAKWTVQSTATDDLHYLIVYSLISAARPSDLTPRVAEALCRLDTKLAGRPGRIKQMWNVRVGEVVASLTRSDARLVDALLARKDFATPGNATWAARVTPSDRERVASAFLVAAQSDPSLEISGPLLEVLDALPEDRIKPLLRARWDKLVLKDDALLRLAKRPDPVDRPKFLEGLDSTDAGVISASLKALESLPASHQPPDLVSALRLLRRLFDDAKSRPLRQQLAAWIAREQGISAIGDEPADIRKHYAILFEVFAREHPTLASKVVPPVAEDWSVIAARVDWSAGDIGRGAEVFRSRKCASCHQGSAALGPDLAASARRLARDDLFAAIVAPNRDIAPAYRPVMVETAEGRTVVGMLVFESADGLILRTGPAASERVDGRSIVARRPSTISLMPEGLLRGAPEREIADLYAYLKSL